MSAARYRTGGRIVNGDACGAFLVILLFLIAFVVYTVTNISVMSRAVTRLELKLDALLQQSGTDTKNPAFLPNVLAIRKVRELLREGRKIEAIRVYRLYNHVGLAEAKAAIEQLQQELGQGQQVENDREGLYRTGEPPPPIPRPPVEKRRVAAPTDHLSPGALTRLPADLHYLIDPALSFSCRTVSDILVCVANLDEEKREELALIADQVLLYGHYRRVGEFLKQYPITEYDECAKLYFFFGLLDHAGLKFERTQDYPT